MVQLVPLLRVRRLGDRRFDYLVPPDLEDVVRVGSVVSAPFGRRTVRAVVVSQSASSEVEVGDLRPIHAVFPDSVPAELLALARVVAERYLCSFESCLRLVVPPLSAGSGGSAGTPKNWVVRTGVPSAGGAADAAGAPAAAPGPAAVTATAAQVSAAPAAASAPVLHPGQAVRLTSKQAQLLASVPPGGIATAELLRVAGGGRSVLRALQRKGEVELVEAPRLALASAAVTPIEEAARVGPRVASEPPTMWPEQEEAVRNLTAAFDQPGFERRLLWGVTGSGKTEVYLRLLAHALQAQAGAILLVPEIALTPQMIGRVRARFGDKVGVLHSGLSSGERRREYGRIAAGDAPLVVGARSAVFAPVDRPRLIIVDESHDTSYKQEEEPRYHVLNVARMRLEAQGGLLVEGSATPSVESMLQPEERIRLTRRAAGTPPVCEVVDMRRQGPGLLLAPRSREALSETLRRGEQAIVLVNRRGYAGHVLCEQCGHVMMCRDCELSLTYHSRSRRLVCHHCGRTYEQPPLCPSCGAGPLVRAAPGTERVVQELRALVPYDRVFHMDSDVATSGRRVEEILWEFSGAAPGVLVGTQMVAKGHDFPFVTLVLVADADTGLYMPDFRAAERTFQLLVQVAGRAGRADRPGLVLIQTWNPDVPCIRMALDQDEDAFYLEELAGRERLGYPPFVDLIRLMTIAEDQDRARIAAQYLVERLAPHFSVGELRGPSRLPILRGKERWHLMVAARDGHRARTVVGRALAQLSGPYERRGVKLLVDVDPQSFS